MHDLNLLVALDALLETGSVSGAAARLQLSEPAMSRTLGRIRRAFDDPILVRSGRGLMPTPRAVALRTEVHAVLSRAQAVFTPRGELDLPGLDRTFTLLASDMAVSMGARLLARIAGEAPGVRLRFLGESPEVDTLALRGGDVDLDIGVIHRPTPPEILVETLGTDRMVPVVRAGHPLADFSLAGFAAAGHVSASRRGLLRGPLDDALAERGLTRRVVVAAPNYGAALLMVAGTDLVGLIADKLGGSAIAALGLIRLPLPFELPLLKIEQAWHARYDADTAHRWLRGRVRETVAEILST